VAEQHRTGEDSSPARVRGVQISPNSVLPKPYSEFLGGRAEVLEWGGDLSRRHQGHLLHRDVTRSIVSNPSS